MTASNLELFAATDLGQRRSNNEDRFAYWAPEDEGARLERGVILMVADGMGGARAGERASQMAVDAVIGGYRGSERADPGDVLRRAFEAANAAIYEASCTDSSCQGMGTTGTAVVVRGGDLHLAHVGDSRAYLVHNGAIRQLTDDHSLVAHLVERGQITAEEARVDPRRNVVTRSIGVASELEVNILALPGALNPGDTLVISSDGLHGVVTDDEILRLVSGPDLGQACHDLIALANQHGGPDNITVILARPVPSS